MMVFARQVSSKKSDIDKEEEVRRSSEVYVAVAKEIEMQKRLDFGRFKKDFFPRRRSRHKSFTTLVHISAEKHYSEEKGIFKPVIGAESGGRY